MHDRRHWEHLARNLPPMDFVVSATLGGGLLFSVARSTLATPGSDQLCPFSYRITSLALLLPRPYPTLAGAQWWFRGVETRGDKGGGGFYFRAASHFD